MKTQRDQAAAEPVRALLVVLSCLIHMKAKRGMPTKATLRKRTS
jgi:hypothetical protein